MSPRLTLLLTSPRVAPGLLSRSAWQALQAADVVLALDAEQAQVRAVSDAEIAVTVIEPAASPTALAAELMSRAADRLVVWIGGPDGDPGLADALAERVARTPEQPELEVLVASWDTPGARLLDAVAVMDRLRSPGGCPWDAEQTHASLVPYLIEEAYEAVEAAESGDADHLAEELGDVLLQVLFHARVAAEAPDGFDIDDVAGRLVDKLVYRHPHVFGGVEVAGSEAVEANWETLKAAEKPDRDHPLDGIPAGLPDLARARKVVTRLVRADREQWLRERVERAGSDPAGDPGGTVASRLMAVVLDAREQGIDPSSALRAFLRSVQQD